MTHGAVADITEYASNQVLTEPFGFPHKRVGEMCIPAFMDASSVAALQASWKPPRGSILLAFSKGFAPSRQALCSLIALSENWPLDRFQTEMKQCENDVVPDETQIASSSIPWQELEPLSCGVLTRSESIPVQLAMFAERSLELRHCLGLSTSADVLQSEEMRCFLTRIPPWLLPYGDGTVSKRESSTADGAVASQMREQAHLRGSTPEQFDEKVIFFAADPRYLVMREYMFMAQIVTLCHKFNASPLEALDVSTYFEVAVRNNFLFTFKMLADWAQISHSRASHVKLVFIEDILCRPDVVFKDLSRFLGMQNRVQPASTVPACVDYIEGAAERCEGIFAAHSSSTSELNFMGILINQFEKYLAEEAPPDVAFILQSHVSRTLQLQNTKVNVPGVLIQSATLVRLAMLALHYTGQCKPCRWKTKNQCHNGENCAFCHELHSKTRRVGKRERLRIARRRDSARCRTPSPAGLSS